MKVLFVSRTWADMPKTPVIEQADALAKYCNIEVQHFFIRKGGIKGYFKAARELSEFIKSQRIDIVHAHYGTSAFAVVISKLFFYNRYKLVVTFHGSDVLLRSELKYSMVAARFSSHNILVSEKMLQFFHGKF
ncbi:MAG: glycosyltransferase family 4 protein, partial [Flavisolibacter sp.]